MTTLYEIQKAYRDLIFKVEELSMSDPTPEQIEEINNLLGINAQEFEGKAEAYACVIQEKKSRFESLKKEAARLTALAKREEKTIQSLQQAISSAMLEQGMDKVETNRFNLSLRKSSAVQITDKSALPDCYLRKEIVSEPDKTAIKQAIQNGDQVPGATLIENRNLQIK